MWNGSCMREKAEPVELWYEPRPRSSRPVFGSDRAAHHLKPIPSSPCQSDFFLIHFYQQALPAGTLQCPASPGVSTEFEAQLNEKPGWLIAKKLLQRCGRPRHRQLDMKQCKPQAPTSKAMQIRDL